LAAKPAGKGEGRGERKKEQNSTPEKENPQALGESIGKPSPQSCHSKGGEKKKLLKALLPRGERKKTPLSSEEKERKKKRGSRLHLLSGVDLCREWEKRGDACFE